jgi:hypothetical protein
MRRSRGHRNLDDVLVAKAKDLALLRVRGQLAAHGTGLGRTLAR